MKTVSKDDLKKQAAEYAVQFVSDGMTVGLGHGSTAIHAIRLLARRIESGDLHNILCIPCSLKVERDASQLGLPLTTFDQHSRIDVTIDGADEIDPHLDVIKGGGGAMLREKVVAQNTKREIIVADESKCSDALGTLFPVPVEVLPFALRPTKEQIEALGAEVSVRMVDGTEHFVSDQGNRVLDCQFHPIADPAKLAVELESIAGVLAHGLFLGLASDVIVATADGIRHTQRN